MVMCVYLLGPTKTIRSPNTVHRNYRKKCNNPDFQWRKFDSLYLVIVPGSDTITYIAHQRWNITSIPQNHTNKFIKLFHIHYGVHQCKPLGWILEIRAYAAVSSIPKESPSLLFTPTGILERSITSLSRSIHLYCCRSQTRTLHTERLSPRNGIGSCHQQYASFKWLITKGSQE
jgi:hypothetical protein